MAAIVLYFHAHQPRRLREFSVFDVGTNTRYFQGSSHDRLNNEVILKKVAHKCYLPANATLLTLLEKHPEFKISFSLSGIFLEQLADTCPEVIKSFRQLVSSQRVELINETYYHSLASIFSPKEFKRQIKLHADLLHELFGVTPTAFRNTELIYNNAIAKTIQDLGFKAILAEGVDRYLEWRSPNFIYTPQGAQSIKLLLKNYRLSDDIAFRFSNKGWTSWPLTSEKYARWVSQVNGNGHVVNLFMDYETIGEHQWADTGIFDFLHALPGQILQHPDNTFMTVSQAAEAFPSQATLDIPHLTSWADLERDVSAWLGNPMQENAARTLYALEEGVFKTKDPQIIRDWRSLTTSDHFYYMCTKWFTDGDVHKYFSPNSTPFEAYNHFMNVLHDIRLRVYAHSGRQKKSSPHATKLKLPLKEKSSYAHISAPAL